MVALGIGIGAGVALAGTGEATPPIVIGKPLAEAKTILTDAGFEPVVSWAVQPGQRGRVISQDPSRGDGQPGQAEIQVSTGLRSTGRKAAEFRTTAGAVYCQYNTAAHLVGVTLVCWTPNDGYLIRLYDEESDAAPPWTYARYVGLAKGPLPGGFRTLKFGTSWRRGPFTCQARTTGLTCMNSRKHGFWLGRYRGVRRW